MYCSPHLNKIVTHYDIIQHKIIIIYKGEHFTTNKNNVIFSLLFLIL